MFKFKHNDGNSNSNDYEYDAGSKSSNRRDIARNIAGTVFSVLFIGLLAVVAVGLVVTIAYKAYSNVYDVVTQQPADYTSLETAKTRDALNSDERYEVVWLGSYDGITSDLGYGTAYEQSSSIYVGILTDTETGDRYLINSMGYMERLDDEDAERLLETAPEQGEDGSDSASE